MTNGDLGSQLDAIPAQRYESPSLAADRYIDDLANREDVQQAFLAGASIEDGELLRSQIASGIQAIELIALGMRNSFRFRRSGETDPMSEAALVRLGWLTRRTVYSDYGTDIVALHAEDAGVQTVDELRAAKGLEPVAVEASRAHDAMKSAIVDRRRQLQNS